jgi:hypothetical protein
VKVTPKIKNTVKIVMSRGKQNLAFYPMLGVVGREK